MDVKACSLMVKKDSGLVVIAEFDGGTGHTPAEKEGPTRKYTGYALLVYSSLRLHWNLHHLGKYSTLLVDHIFQVNSFIS